MDSFERVINCTVLRMYRKEVLGGFEDGGYSASGSGWRRPCCLATCSYEVRGEVSFRVMNEAGKRGVKGDWKGGRVGIYGTCMHARECAQRLGAWLRSGCGGVSTSATRSGEKRGLSDLAVGGREQKSEVGEDGW